MKRKKTVENIYDTSSNEIVQENQLCINGGSFENKSIHLIQSKSAFWKRVT